MSISGINNQSISSTIATIDQTSATSRSEATTEARLPENASLLEKKTALSLEKLESAYAAYVGNCNSATLSNLKAAQEEFSSNCNELKLETLQSGNPEIKAAYERMDEAQRNLAIKYSSPNHATNQSGVTKEASALVQKTDSALEELKWACYQNAHDLVEVLDGFTSDYNALMLEAARSGNSEIQKAFVRIDDEYNSIMASIKQRPAITRSENVTSLVENTDLALKDLNSARQHNAHDLEEAQNTFTSNYNMLMLEAARGGNPEAQAAFVRIDNEYNHSSNDSNNVNIWTWIDPNR